MSKAQLLGWDACIFIDKLEERAGRIEFVQPIWRLAERGDIRIVASSLVIVETINVKEVLPLEQICIINDFFRRKEVSLQLVDRKVALRAQELRRTYTGLTTPDAVHLATATIKECSHFLTTDGVKPRKRALLPLDKQIDGLRILTPEAYLREKYPALEGKYGLVGLQS